ncbi:cytochrome C biogenesis family protein [Lysobacter gummosus]|uniref:Cytochrome c-type biogenesis protein n=1 Tax=Lysobacter gummosus TaxID=262324 RepID=A0ABY3X9L5_9GAMM|nr:cytochrome c-type biogenesis protein [Lysobacter gummosus]ALN91795.1 cytochrome C biogenesis family protein [Lysobacter gummosus]UNP27462.1 cytochrome c-type biogenesis protein CcmH [Lysobacter gummosus]
MRHDRECRAVPPFEKGGQGGFAFPRTLLATAALILTLALTLTTPAIAQPASDPAPLSFNDNTEERRFHALVAELRCVMCQNQSLADSNAQIAHDLRREVLVLMRQGKSDGEIKDFLVARYGEFVLYRPQMESKTWLLWFGPALVLLAGGFVVARVIRARGANAHDGSARNDEEQEW